MTTSHPQDGDLARRLLVLESRMSLKEIVQHGQSSADVVDYYNKSSIGYRLLHSNDGSIHMALNPEGTFSPEGYTGQVRLVEEVVVRQAASDVLELASGRGFNLRRLGVRHPGTRFSGIDLTPSHVRWSTSRARRLPNVNYLVADFASIPFDDLSFDVVFSIESLCHALSIEDVIREVYRVARPGATVIVIDAWRAKCEGALSDVEAFAAEVVERSMAVGTGRLFADWLYVAESEGFIVTRVVDLSNSIMPNLIRFERMAQKYLKWGMYAKLLSAILPRRLTGNVAAGYLMPSTVAAGIHTYALVELHKPG